MADIALSICIPTYNFGRFIGQTLDSITAQLPADVEVVVVDGASTDDTAAVVRDRQTRCASINYVRLEARGGIDRDMAQSVELAKGTYCWLFSSDDVMRPGALALVLAAIASGSDVYICKHTVCTFDMQPFGVRPVLALEQEENFDLGAAPQRLRYCSLAQTTEAFFSFMSGLVVKRSKWLSVPLNEKFVGSCWAHVARLLELIRAGLVVGWIPRVLLDQRGDNDSFADRGVIHRFQIAIEGYHRLADEFFGHDSIEAFHVRRVIRAEFRFRTFLATRVRLKRQGRAQDLVALDELMRRTFEDVPVMGWLVRVGCKLFPSRAYPMLQSFYHRSVARLRRRPGGIGSAS
jgi:abequosyltransferase